MKATPGVDPSPAAVVRPASIPELDGARAVAALGVFIFLAATAATPLHKHVFRLTAILNSGVGAAAMIVWLGLTTVNGWFCVFCMSPQQHVLQDRLTVWHQPIINAVPKRWYALHGPWASSP